MIKNSPLFTPISINGVRIRNRFMRSATYEGLGGSTGLAREALHEKIAALSSGEVGLIVPGFVFPTKSGKTAPRQCGMSREADSAVWRRTVDAVHANGSSIVFQLCHGGSRCLERAVPAITLSSDEIEGIIDSFAQSALRLISIDADGVQLHAAHGFLLSDFLSPRVNRRRDAWGGSVEKNVRIVAEIASRIKEFAPPKFIVAVKLNANDFVDGGVVPELCAQYVRALMPYVDLFEISAGMGGRPSYGTRIKFDDDTYRRNLSVKEYNEIVPLLRNAANKVQYFDAYNQEAVSVIHRLVPEAKLAIVGGNRDINKMEKLINDGTVQMISMSRPFLKDPLLVKKLREGKIKEIECNSCGLCSYYPEPLRIGTRCHNYK